MLYGARFGPETTAEHEVRDLDVVSGMYDEDGRTLAVLSVPEGARVLLVGTDGKTAEALEARGCKVTSMKVAEVQVPELDKGFRPGEFDVALLLGVLPYLVRPNDVISQLARLLGDDGRLIATVPNATHWGVRLRFLQGGLPVQSDSSQHEPVLRLFDSSTLDRLLQANGLKIVEKLRVRHPLAESDATLDSSLPPEVISLLVSGPEAETHGFVVVAGSGKATQTRPSLAEELQDRLYEVERLLGERSAEAEELENQLHHLRLDLTLKDDFAFEQRKALRAAEDEAEELRAALGQARLELAARDEELETRREQARRIEEVTSGSAYRLAEQMSRSVGRYPSLARAARWVARRLVPGS